jgi:hypothetical protein
MRADSTPFSFSYSLAHAVAEQQNAVARKTRTCMRLMKNCIFELRFQIVCKPSVSPKQMRLLRPLIAATWRRHKNSLEIEKSNFYQALSASYSPAVYVLSNINLFLVDVA